MSLALRSTQAELLDGDGVDAEEYARCLADLASVNRVTLTHLSTLRWLARAVAGLPPGATVAVLDVAYGDGDLLRAIHRWAVRRGIAVRLAGIDLNPVCAVAAQRATPATMAIDYRTGNVFDAEPEPRPDFIVSSQFTHHLADADVVRFLQWMERFAGRGWFIADLHRHVLAYYGFPLLARLFGWHRIVRLDGTTSIARSFRRAEWLALLAQAGIAAQVRWRFPFRLCVGRLK
jgi:2-polyprenyl-3-methyl-5-hydroxy-6-metoxy-1,4-benzoquinol methylase